MFRWRAKYDNVLILSMVGWEIVFHIFGLFEYYDWDFRECFEVIFFGIVTFGISVLCMLPVAEFSGKGSDTYYTLWAHGGAIALFFLPILGEKIGLLKIATWKDDPELVRSVNYMNLVVLKGCGPRTAERILSKVEAGKTLTEREQQFWDQAL